MLGLLLALLISRLSQGYQVLLNLSLDLCMLNFVPWQQPLVQRQFVAGGVFRSKQTVLNNCNNNHKNQYSPILKKFPLCKATFETSLLTPVKHFKWLNLQLGLRILFYRKNLICCLNGQQNNSCRPLGFWHLWPMEDVFCTPWLTWKKPSEKL